MRASSSFSSPYTASRAPCVAELDVLSSDVGFTEFTMMFWLPSRLIDSSAWWLAPSPTASIAITEPTPNTMPSIVRNERVLWRQTSVTPSRMNGQ